MSKEESSFPELPPWGSPVGITLRDSSTVKTSGVDAELEELQAEADKIKASVPEDKTTDLQQETRQTAQETLTAEKEASDD